MQPGDLRSGELVGLGGAKFGLDDLVQKVPVEGAGSGLAFRLDVLEHKPVGQSRDCQCAPFGGLLSRRVVTICHRPQDALGSPSGGLWRGLADVRDGEAPDRRAAPGARPVTRRRTWPRSAAHGRRSRGAWSPETANSFACGFRPSTTRLAWLLLRLARKPPGKHRGNTGKEGQGNSRRQDMLKRPLQ